MPIWRVPAVWTGSWSGSPGVNVWHVRTAGDPALTLPDFLTQIGDAIDAIGDFYTAVSGWMRPSMTIALGTDITNAEDGQVPNVSGLLRSVSTGAGSSGAPTPLTVCVNWRTALRARRGMGRTFLGPLAAASMDTSGSLSSECRSVIGAAAAALVTRSTTANAWAVGVHGLEEEWDGWPNTPPPSTPRLFRDTVTHSISNKFSVLRSRRD